MTAPQSEIDEWLEQATAGDLNYMAHLIKLEKSQLIIACYETLDDQPEILAQTKDILKRYTL